jgi:hypothetical protein
VGSTSLRRIRASPIEIATANEKRHLEKTICAWMSAWHDRCIETQQAADGNPVGPVFFPCPQCTRRWQGTMVRLH